jgi:hypothetical protein
MVRSVSYSTPTTLIVPRYLPTMAFIVAGMVLTSRRTINTLDVANGHIWFGVTNALNEANRKVHQALEPTQEQKNMALMENVPSPALSRG